MPSTPTIQLNIFQREEIGKVRKAQEDSHFHYETPNGYLFVVCDGMGGHVGGAEASSIAVESIFEFFYKEKHTDITRALNASLGFANMQILGKVNENPALKGMGTTACVLLLQEDKAYIAHVGDSRIYLYLGKEKELHRITKDHSFVQTLVDLPEGHPDKISDDEAENHPNKNRILKALGIKLNVAPTICEKPILPKNDDIFLICSDGLNGMLPDSQIESVLKDNSTLQEKGDTLIKLALEAGGVDNITLQMVEISHCPKNREQSVFTSYNPKCRPQSRVSKSRKLKQIVIGTIVAFFVLTLGGWYGWGKYWEDELNKKIEKQKVVIANQTKEYNSAEQTLINNKIEIARLKRDGGHVKKGAIKEREATQKEQEEELVEKEKTLAAEQAKLINLESELDDLQSKKMITNIRKLKKIIKNESNNDRKK